MEKIILDLSKQEPLSEFHINDKKVLVKRYINMSDKIIILNAYFASQSDNIIDDYITNNYSLMIAVLDVMTNIDIKDILVDAVVDSGLWKQVADSIFNLDELYVDVAIIRESLAEKNAIGASFKTLIDAATSALNKVKEIDFSENGIKSLLENFESVKKDVGKFYPVINDAPKEEVAEKKHRKPKPTS